MTAGEASWRELYTPKLATVLREGYRLSDLRADAVSGLTVAIVALPLSMAIAISSGATPAAGLYTSIIGGFLISALGGSRFQIGGPAGAFIVLVAACVARHGIEGLAVATILAGLMLAAIGAFRLGGFIKYIPYPVTVGFTAGIAVVIFASEIRDLLGLTLAGPEPGPLVPKLEALFAALPSANAAAIGLAAGTAATILALRRWRPKWPGFLIAVVAASAAAQLLHLPVETIGTRFGGVPAGLPAPHLPAITPATVAAVFPDAVAFALLGGIESLLSAVVADSMSGRRHRSNCELVAQGIANVVSALFGGICVTGTIARTATNIRAGAHTPVSGILHAFFLLAFMLVAAPLARFIPLAALAAILGVVAWNMAEKTAFATLMRTSKADAAVLGATFLLTIFRGLTEGIVVGFSLACLVFLHRMAGAVEVDAVVPPLDEDRPDSEGPAPPAEAGVLHLRISGAFFFGAAGMVGALLDRLGEHPRRLVIDFQDVSLFDSSAAATMESFIRKVRRQGAEIEIVAASPAVRTALENHGVREPEVRFLPGEARLRAAPPVAEAAAP